MTPTQLPLWFWGRARYLRTHNLILSPELFWDELWWPEYLQEED